MPRRYLDLTDLWLTPSARTAMTLLSFSIESPTAMVDRCIHDNPDGRWGSSARRTGIYRDTRLATHPRRLSFRTFGWADTNTTPPHFVPHALSSESCNASMTRCYSPDPRLLGMIVVLLRQLIYVLHIHLSTEGLIDRLAPYFSRSKSEFFNGEIPFDAPFVYLSAVTAITLPVRELAPSLKHSLLLPSPFKCYFTTRRPGLLEC
ncbi:hypothetical protein B0H16DRAFT_1605868 [Mycena metata]|uniref:Uncharacterized protein n=1 Tax=Mycena metata TaxID=1033252 RepID=A0AAD7HH64_9AGAR|nr:hypothetical protein B0H16DRAFT_1605868 [Mycena metata]